MMQDTGSSDALFVLLDGERANLIAQFERVPAARRTERPGEGAWSAVEIAEHVARVEVGVARMLASRATMPLTATPGEVAEAQLTPGKIAAVRVRDKHWSAPDRTLPTGTLTPGMVMEQLAGAHAGLRAAFVATDNAVLDGAIIPHPFIGPLTLRAWVELVAHHDARHAAQMAEVADRWLGAP
jgi:uncharacterized damage-inducible protein DinB